MDVGLRGRFNDELKGAFHSEYDYAKVYVLLLYWKDDNDTGFKVEADALDDLFVTHFNYPRDHVERFEIPLEGSLQLTLERRIIDFILNKGHEYLLIIHYGGHGDADAEDKQLVWANSASNGPIIKWFNIQQRLLDDSEADVLLIFDCCYAAAGPRSFTSIMVREMKALLSVKSSIVISEFHKHLGRRQSGLFETPQYSELQPGSGRRIKLEKLHSHAPNSTAPTCASRLKLHVSTRERLDEETGIVFGQIIEWMKKLAPRIISDLAVEEVYHASETLREFVKEEPTETIPHPVFQQLSQNAKQEALDLCHELDAVLEGGAALSRLPASFNPDTSKDYEDMARNFVNKLENKVTALKKSLERNIVARCRERELLVKVMNDEKVQTLGITDTLRMKDILLDSALTGESMEVAQHKMGSQGGPDSASPRLAEKHFDQIGHVFVEYKYYSQSGNDGTAERMASERVIKLAKVLGEPKSEEFQSLLCLWWYHEPENRRFGLAFQIPATPGHKFVTLLDIINSKSSERAKTKFRPTLEQRFDMAGRIGHAVRKWHLAGWVHQGISSRNIFLLRDESKRIDYSRPFLCGFEYSRPSGEKSYPRSEDTVLNVYQHPDRQGYPNIQFQRTHDIYSFGVLLLEIGLWQPAHELFEGKVGITAEGMKRDLIDNCETRLAYYMGTNYLSATLTCLKDGFGIVMDDSAHSRLSKAFDSLVLQKITCGKTLG